MAAPGIPIGSPRADSVRVVRGPPAPQRDLELCSVHYNSCAIIGVVYTTNTEVKDSPMPTPTEQAYSELQHAYDYFNQQLFANQLPPCLITMQRKNRTYGYFSGERWNDQAGAVTDEIALNPQHFATRSTEEVLSTLVHEMVHLWQYHCGTPPRKGYHDQAWAAKMDAVGLCPSDTAKPGGKRTGQHMEHYIAPGGPYAQAAAALLASPFVISWRDREREEGPGKDKAPGKAGVRTKYTCPTCGLNAWAKQGVVLLCGACEEALTSAEAGLASGGPSRRASACTPNRAPRDGAAGDSPPHRAPVRGA